MTDLEKEQLYLEFYEKFKQNAYKDEYLVSLISSRLLLAFQEYPDMLKVFVDMINRANAECTEESINRKWEELADSIK